VSKRVSRRILASVIGEELLKGAPQSQVIKNLAAYLLENNRTKEVDLILADVESYLAKRGHVVANLESAFKPSEASITSMKSMIKRQTDARHITIKSKIMPSLIGGARVNFAGLELDNTVARKLKMLTTISGEF